MNLALKLLLKCQPRQQQKSRQTTNGFTMIELLIGTIMAFLIITPLLGFVVSVLNDDTREQAKSENDFEQQAAIGFISEDVGQAYYIYSEDKEQNDGSIVDEMEAIEGDLPNVDGGTPILAFWKQQTIPNAVPPFGSDDKPEDCGEGTVECDDTTVRALVVYYLVQDDNEIWCQPEGGNCPQRIVRYVVKDGLEIARGTGVLYDENLVKDSQKRTPGFNPDFNPNNPTENVTDGNVRTNGEVLINYVSDFKISDVPGTSDSVKITIQSDGRRRIAAKDSCVKDDGEIENSAFCPTATVQVQGLRLDF
jgi:type II secretory pathway pseudopilin PulG